MSINSTLGKIQLNFARGAVVINLHREDLIFISLYSIIRGDIMQLFAANLCRFKLRRVLISSMFVKKKTIKHEMDCLLIWPCKMHVV